MEKKLLVGVVGTSITMGTRHLRAVIQNGAELVAICDTNPETLRIQGEAFNVPEEGRFTDWREMLNIPEIDAVILVTPDQVHREMSEAFLAAGKHVLCEKPLALTRDDLNAIVKAAESSSCKYMVGQVSRFVPAFAKAKELVDTGEIGEVFFAESEYAHDYARILYDWRKDSARHGVIGGGCHAVDLLRWILGDPQEVFAYGSHKLLPEVDYDDATIAVMKYPNDVIGKVFVSTGCKRTYTMRTVIYGTKGTIICDNRATHVVLYQVGEDGITVNPEPQLIPVKVEHHNTRREFEIFADHIQNDTPVQMSAREGAKSIAACIAIVESANTGKPVVPDYNF